MSGLRGRWGVESRCSEGNGEVVNVSDLLQLLLDEFSSGVLPGLSPWKIFLVSSISFVRAFHFCLFFLDAPVDQWGHGLGLGAFTGPWFALVRWTFDRLAHGSDRLPSYTPHAYRMHTSRHGHGWIPPPIQYKISFISHFPSL